MAKKSKPYFDLIVESYMPSDTSGMHGPIHVRPIDGQKVATTLHVECSKELAGDYPVGTRFRIKAKLTDRAGGGEYIYSYFGWKYAVIGTP
jgi:hypothetical protein